MKMKINSLNVKIRALYRHTGFMLKSSPGVYSDPVCVEFSNLNPEVGFRQVFTRFELITVALWLVVQAVTVRQRPE